MKRVWYCKRIRYKWLAKKFRYELKKLKYVFSKLITSITAFNKKKRKNDVSTVYVYSGGKADMAVEMEIAQMLRMHPILNEKNSYKRKYINVLEYFVRKYSSHDQWANKTMDLYKRVLLENTEDYMYNSSALLRQYKSLVCARLKFKPLRIISYRYCFVIDCIFINAITNKKKGEKIFSELSSIYHVLYKKKITQLFDALYTPDSSFDRFCQCTYLADCWEKNRKFILEKPIKVLVTSTVSAGKSTLINALVGKKVTRTKNDVCTSKNHIIKNKAYEDGYCYELDYNLNLDADFKMLMDDNSKNRNDEIIVGTHFRTIGENAKRVWLIDTPGVNSSQYELHRDITERSIRICDVDLLVYLLNCENIGSIDDRQHLQFVLENYSGKTVFVVNKLDKFREKEDSVPETLSAVVSELTDMGFISPLVVPISSFAAYLAKLCYFGETLDEELQEELNRMSRKLKKSEYQFNTYYPEQKCSDLVLDGNNEIKQLLLHSGILQLENIIYGARG